MYVKAVEGNLPGRDNMRLVIEAGSIQPCLFLFFEVLEFSV
jgi:hypothetical protein